jgi:hypothetical protein
MAVPLVLGRRSFVGDEVRQRRAQVLVGAGLQSQRERAEDTGVTGSSP